MPEVPLSGGTPKVLAARIAANLLEDIRSSRTNLLPISN